MKKNIRSIPKEIIKKVKVIKNAGIVVGCAVKFKEDAIKTGKLAHLGISLSNEGLKFPNTIIPSENQGKYSGRNINGFEIVRKDLPKETLYNTVETPNWGDSYNGTHTVDLPYKKFRRDFQPPRELEISIECKDTRPDLPSYAIAFQVKEVLDKSDKEFEARLFENLNLLQENVGACGIEAADIPLIEYLKSLHVSWEILPPGTLDETLQRLFNGKTPTTREKDVATKRYNFFLTLKPKSLVFGQSGFRRYFGALIEDDLVVFENIEYGNAIYILFEKWEELSKLSRLDLLSGKFGNSFERIIHTGKWENTVKSVIKKRRTKK